jgi:poly-gamma-glutamate synthesis protein (capsule biosynthesis protein)
MQKMTSTMRPSRAACKGLIIVLGATALSLLSCATTPDRISSSARVEVSLPLPPIPPPVTPTPSLPSSWTIAAVGDVLLHQGLHQQALRATTGHRSLWRDVEPWIQGADLAYANLEGPIAPGVTVTGRQVADPGRVFDKRVYTSFPQFNYHTSLATDLALSGFDVVSTANNHALDRAAVGVDRTIDHLRAAGLAFTGTRRSDEPTGDWFTLVDRPGLRTAWIACSFSTNGLPDRAHQVLDCYRDQAQLLDLVRALAARPDIDAVIATPHFGNEYQPSASPQQRALAHALVDAGALAVLGSHPHVPQGWEARPLSDGRTALIVYSLGNFVSGQFHRVPTRATLLLSLTLSRTAAGRVEISKIDHVPLEMVRDAQGYRVAPLRPTGHPAIRGLLQQLYGVPPELHVKPD